MFKMLIAWIAASIVVVLRVSRVLPPASFFHAVGGYLAAEKTARIFLHLPIGVIASVAQALNGSKRTELPAGRISVSSPLPLLRPPSELRGQEKGIGYV